MEKIIKKSYLKNPKVQVIGIVFTLLLLSMLALQNVDGLTTLASQTMNSLTMFASQNQGRLDEIPKSDLSSRSRSEFTDTYKKSDGENFYILKTEILDSEKITQNASGTYYNIVLNVSRTEFADDIIEESTIKGILNKGLLRAYFASQNKYQAKGGGKSLDNEQARKIITDFTNPPVIATKGELLSYDLGSFNLFLNSEEHINIIVGVKEKQFELNSLVIKVGSASSLWTVTSYVGTGVNLSTSGVSPQGMFFNGSGHKLFEVEATSDVITGYNCSIGWDLSTCVSSESQDFSVWELTMRGVSWQSNGSKMFFQGSAADNMYEFGCSKTWDISSCTYTSNFSIATVVSQTNPTDMFFQPNGTNLYISGRSPLQMHQLVCDTPWLLSSCNYNGVVLGTPQNRPGGIFFKEDGLKMYEFGDGSDTTYQYSCSSAWNLSSCSYDSVSLLSADTVLNGGWFSGDGNKFFEIGQGGDKIYEFEFADPIITLQTPINRSEFTTSTGNKAIEFTALVTDNTNATNITYYFMNSTFDILATNFSILGNSSYLSNITQNINNTGNWWWNASSRDIDNNFGTSTLFNFNLTSSADPPEPGESCSYTGPGNWEILCPENCTLNVNEDLNGVDLSITGYGRLVLDGANISNIKDIYIKGDGSTEALMCKITIINGGEFR